MKYTSRFTALMRVCGIALGLTLAGCTTHIAPAGPQTYMVSTTMMGVTPAATVKARAYTAADAWCRKRGLVMVPVSVEAHDMQPFGQPAHAELYFKALPPGSPGT